ncbi:MAG: LacI family DNA-binding transcriptional regulator [Oscillospiraceae bacterium]|nr:LacI family DNA-binding transcriptional regulator [Oscillospiraceae bacterium]MDD4369029.1 LacI family DNA-binding transcriptional regulator [Oscillospiraceae bacterium]
MNKPTMQQIAEQLSTSRITVWKALNNRPGVSDQKRREIFEAASQMGYFAHSASLPPAEPASRARTVAVVVSRPESSLFWMQILHQLAKEFSALNVNLMYTYIHVDGPSSLVLPASLSDGSVDGMIVMNVYSAQVLRQLSSLALPKVFLDTVPALPFPQLSGDLVLIEGYNSIRQITSQLLELGLRRLCFVGDIAYAQTNADRYHGFLDAFADYGLQADPGLCLTQSLELATHFEQISSFLESLRVTPDAIICASDFLAHFVERYYSEHHLPREGRIVLTGFDDSDEYANVAGRITTVAVQTDLLGSRLAARLAFRLDHPDAWPELSYVRTKVIYRNLPGKLPAAKSAAPALNSAGR